MLFVWWAALRLSVHLLTVKERRCDTPKRSVITPSIIKETIPNHYHTLMQREEGGMKKKGRAKQKALT